MLKDQFYSISNLNINDTNASAEVLLNPEHTIYSGHFPNKPVTPGVCQLQIVKDTISEIHSQPYFLSSAKNIKFLNVLTPQQNHLKLELDYAKTNSGLKVTAILSAEDKIFLKFMGVFKTRLKNSP